MTKVKMSVKAHRLMCRLAAGLRGFPYSGDAGLKNTVFFTFRSFGPQDPAEVEAAVNEGLLAPVGYSYMPTDLGVNLLRPATTEYVHNPLRRHGGGYTTAGNSEGI